MLNTITFNCTGPGQGTYKKLYALGYKALMSFVILFTLFLSNSANAQTVRQSVLTCAVGGRDACSSNDLSVVSVDIVSSGCITCSGTETVTLPLTMTIHNGTGSTRTSFALYGTLSPGAKIISGGVEYSGNVFICVGPITVTKGDQTFPVGNISFTCGQDLALTNNFLKWTDASDGTKTECETLALKTSCQNGPTGIGPKCGFAPSITINGPVPAPTLGKVDPTCTVSTGKVTITSSTTGFTFKLDNGNFESYPSGGWTVSPGQHCVVAKRTSDNCTSSSACITIPGAPANPDRPRVTLQEATICGNVTAPTVTVSCPEAGTYTCKQPGETDQTKTYPTDNPVVFTVKPGIGFSITVTNTAGCTSAATDCTNYLNYSCPSPVAKAAVQTIELAAPKTKVLAAPNPFTNRVQFKLESAVSGMGSLELYNTMGQKVATVYQGYVEAGKPLNKEYMVKSVSRSSLIYVFRVGDQKVTGKLLNW